ncbi:hypothetical protein GCM10009647_091350 [Streptomyces sanglieri]
MVFTGADGAGEVSVMAGLLNVGGWPVAGLTTLTHRRNQRQEPLDSMSEILGYLSHRRIR